MNEKDIELLNKVTNNPIVYEIYVDNDNISVWNNSTEESEGKFDNFGEEFIYGILKHLGTNVYHA